MPRQEFNAVLELLGMLVRDPRTAVLMLLLIAASFCDIRTRRIPNALVFFGALFGLTYNIALPYPGNSVFFPVAGLLTGFALFLPLYVVRVTGAGDVKLLAMIGAFLGPLATLNSAVATFIAGGVLSFVYVLQRGTTLRMFENVSMFVRLGVLGAVAGSPQLPRFAPENSAGRLPYAVAIAIGTIGYLVLRQLGLV